MSEADKANPPPAERETVTVEAKRLAWKERWNGAKHEVFEGDINSSYSADLIGMDKPVRKPFKWRGELWLTVSMSGHGGVEQAEAYRMIPAQLFTGTATSYREKTSIEGGDMARGDPNGFYDRMAVKNGGQNYILKGPPIRFVSEPTRPDVAPEPEQMSLFS